MDEAVGANVLILLLTEFLGHLFSHDQTSEVSLIFVEAFTYRSKIIKRKNKVNNLMRNPQYRYACS